MNIEHNINTPKRGVIMSNLVKFGSIFIALAISFASDNSAKVVEQETISNTVKTLNLNNKY